MACKKKGGHDQRVLLHDKKEDCLEIEVRTSVVSGEIQFNQKKYLPIAHSSFECNTDDGPLQYIPVGQANTLCSGMTIFSCNDLVPFFLHGLTLIPAWISNYIHYNMWDEITNPFETSTVQQLNFGNG